MGMSIDEAIERYESNAEYERTHGNLQGCLEFRQLVEWLRKYQLMQADYENRLKADLVAILTEIQTEIDEIPINADNSEPFKLGQASAYDKCENLIYQKINAIKAESEET